MRRVAGRATPPTPSSTWTAGARRGTPVKVQAVRNPADPDADMQATGGLLPGPGARLAGPTFEEWLDQQ